MKEFKPISRMVKNSLPVTKDPPADDFLQQSLVDYWNQQVGIVAPHTYPLLFQSGRLVVFCDSAAWATQIRHQKPSLLRQLKDANFNISDIYPKIRPTSPPRETQSKMTKKTNPLSQSNSTAIRELAGKIEHDGLRKSLIRLSNRAEKEE